jgi:hypothetical protein
MSEEFIAEALQNRLPPNFFRKLRRNGAAGHPCGCNCVVPPKMPDGSGDTPASKKYAKIS